MTRHIDFDGIQNFRDFGGYDTACGRGMVAGRLFRSANHAYATEADLTRMREMGVAAIVDLRQPSERAHEPSRRWDGFAAQVIENDIVSDHPDWTKTMPGSDVTPQWFHDDGVAFYRNLPFEPRHIDLFRRYFQAVAAAEGPIVVHCAAGKDRTGMICAMTHHIAGVHRDDLMADYLLTNDETRIERKMRGLASWLRKTFGHEPSQAALRTAVSVHPEYLETAFRVIDERHGSLDGYLQQALDLDAAMRERILQRILA